MNSKVSTALAFVLGAVAGYLTASVLGGSIDTKIVASLLGVVVGALLVPFVEIVRNAWLPSILTRIIGPELKLEIDEAMIDTADKKQSYIRVRLENVRPRTAKACRGYLTAIERWDEQRQEFVATEYRDFLPLIWSFDGQLVNEDISFDIPRHLDVLTVEKDTIGFVPQLWHRGAGPMLPGVYADLARSSGLFRFTVRISISENYARDNDAQRIQFVAHCDGRWPLNPNKV